MDKHFFDSQLNKIKLIKIFSNMDTQSAIVAAIAISIMSFFVTGFSNLCNYIYWSAYFTKFNIPLSYIDEAIIHENGIKYSVILFVPLLVLFWLLLGVVKNTIKKSYTKIKKRIEGDISKRRNRYAINALKTIFVIISASLLISGFFLLTELIEYQKYYVLFVLYLELTIFVFWNISKAILGRRFSFSQKKYYIIRILGIIIILYLIIGNVYFSGCFENYSENGMQRLQIINKTDINYSIDDGDEINSQLVLFETADHYYVTDVTITNMDGLNVKIWGADSYCFIDKVECPVKSIYARLLYIGGDRYQDPFINKMAELYVGVSVVFCFIFIILLSIPMRKEEKTEETKEPKASNVSCCQDEYDSIKIPCEGKG